MLVLALHCMALMLPSRLLTPRAPPPQLCTVPPEGEGGWENYEWWEDGMSVVEYDDGSSDALRFGVYTAYTLVDEQPHIRPL